MKIPRSFWIALSVLLCSASTGAHAAGSSAGIDGSALGLAWIAPFAGLLLSIAVMPLAVPHFWHRHYGKVAVAWVLAFALPFGWHFGWGTAWHEFIHVIVADYVPFVVLLGALYVAAGSVRFKGTLSGTPVANTLFMLFGMLIASAVGTTGACMLLIRPLLQANAWRARTSHTWVFFIFLVGNIGGALTPLGDPPLYIGFLQGIDFFWPTRNLAGPTALIAGLLLAIFYALDVRALRKEEKANQPVTVWAGIEGVRNIAVLAAIAGTVLITGLWNSAVTLDVLGIPVTLDNIVRTGIIAALGLLAWVWTDPQLRRYSEFRWGPIQEVAKLFAAIFICIVPALAIIGAGENGVATPLISLLNLSGQPKNETYFWITGLLSSLLDNAPTYLLFFNLAGGDAAILQTTLAKTLAAISAGAVFMGALTYIGNAPNFMVRSIVTAHGRRMPSFFGYMAWSGAFLLPLFVLVGLAFF